MRSQRESSTQGLIDGLRLQVLREGIVRDDVEERSQRARDSHAVDGLDIITRQASIVKTKIRGDAQHALEAVRNGQVEPRRHDVRQVVQRQRGRVTVDALRLSATVVRPELPQHQVGSIGCRKPREPVDASSFPNPVADANLVGVAIVGVPSRDGLSGREQALLRGRDPVQLIRW